MQVIDGSTISPLATAAVIPLLRDGVHQIPATDKRYQVRVKTHGELLLSTVLRDGKDVSRVFVVPTEDAKGQFKTLTGNSILDDTPMPACITDKPLAPVTNEEWAWIVDFQNCMVDAWIQKVDVEKSSPAIAFNQSTISALRELAEIMRKNVGFDAPTDTGAPAWEQGMVRILGDDKCLRVFDLALGGYLPWLWASSGYRRVLLDSDITMLLAATSLHQVDPDEIRFPWPAFVVELPPSLIQLANTDGSIRTARYILAGEFRDRDGNRHFGMMVQSAGDVALLRTGTMSDLVADEPWDDENAAATPMIAPIEVSDIDKRSALLCRRIVAGLCLMIQSHSNGVEDPNSEFRSTEQKAKRGQPASHMLRIRGKTTINVTVLNAVRDYVAGTRGSLGVRHLVRGHWRLQPRGPREEQNRVRIWIQPFWRGPSDGTVLETTTEIR